MSLDMQPVLDQIETERTKITATYEAEMAKLNQMAATLQSFTNGNGAATAEPDSAARRRPGRPAGTTTNRRGRRTGEKTREDEAYEIVSATPGIKIPEIAETMKIAPNYLYRIMPKLLGAKRVKKDDKGGWHPVVS